MKKNIEEKIVSTTGSISGIASIFGSWQICHNICIGIIAVLGLIGITLTGMPLLFLTKIAIPLWTMAVILFFITLYLYNKHNCISNKLILFNFGILIAGIPFSMFERYRLYLWIIGGIIIVITLIAYIKGKIKKGYKHEKKKKKR